MKQFFGVCLLGLLWLSGCSQTLDIPSINNQNPRPIETIVLGNELGPKELKNIFKALNEKGQLNSLKPWFEEAPESGLKAWGKFFNRYLYQDAFQSNGLLQILSSRNSQKSFSLLNDKVSELSKTETYKLQKQTTFKILSDPQSLDLIERNAYFFDPKWQMDINPIYESLRKTLAHSVNSKSLFEELRTLMSNPQFTNPLYAVAKPFEKTNLGHNLIRALKNLNPDPETNPFPAFIKNLQVHFNPQTTTPSDIQKILALLKTLDQPSQGLFLSAEQTLKTETGEELIRLLGERLDQVLIQSISKALLENLGFSFDGQTLTPEFWRLLPREKANGLPTVQFQHLYRRIYSTLTRFTNSNGTESDINISLNAYVLTRWMELLSSNHLSQIKGEGIQKIKISAFEFNLNLLEIDEKGLPKKDENSKFILSKSIAADLKALGFTEWTTDLEQLVKIHSFGKTLYVVSKHKSSDFNSVLLHTIERCHSVRRFADPVPLFTGLFLKILHADPDTEFTISQLDTSNMLNSINTFITKFSLSDLRKVLYFATETLQIDRLSSDDVERIRSLFPNNPEALKIVGGLLKNISVLRNLDKSEKNGISLLSFFHTLNRSVPNDSLEGMTEVLRFIYQSTLFQNPPEASPILNLLLTPSFSGTLLKAFAQFETPTERAFMRAMKKSFGSDVNSGSGLKAHLEFINLLLHSDEAGLRALWDNVMTSKLSGLTEDEFNWIYHFIGSGSFKNLAKFIQNHSSRENLLQLSLELERLCQNGGLKDAFTLLSNIKNERMQRLALTFLQLEKSGELKALLSILNTLTKG